MVPVELVVASLVEVASPGVTVVVVPAVVVAGAPVVVISVAFIAVALVVFVPIPKSDVTFQCVAHKTMTDLGMFDLRLAGDLEDTRMPAPPAGRCRCASTAVNHRC